MEAMPCPTIAAEAHRILTTHVQVNPSTSPINRSSPSHSYIHPGRRDTLRVISSPGARLGKMYPSSALIAKFDGTGHLGRRGDGASALSGSGEDPGAGSASYVA
ncbi:uncharacterized protein N7482_001519 [Penicillium canariense]|uniref:Uncharacterized protein n=1 Tax=Penicillium canariense TaxID=189055 RepID=A0A9W9IFS6_9EURO|nr:uncharacterized protein N7482_001519 [Penicillium canariense]KAJ5175642.1 hypothetical protein N7482_001519 [Penicillium canariense]